MRQHSIFDSMHPETSLSQRVSQSCNLLRQAWKLGKERCRDLQARKRLELIADIGNYLTSRYIEGLVRELRLDIGTPGDDVRALIELLEKVQQKGFLPNATPARLEEIKQETITIWQGLLRRKKGQ